MTSAGTISLNSRQGYLKLFIENYNIWRDHKILHGWSDLIQVQDQEQGLSCYAYDEVDLINQDTGHTVCIDCLGEGIRYRNFFEKYRTDKHYIIFSNGWWDTDKIQLPFSYDLIQHYFYLFEMLDTFMSPNRFNFYFDKEYTMGHKPYVFVAMIGNTRSKRDFVVETLQNTITYDNYVLRYSGQDLAAKVDFLDVVQFQPGEFDPYISINEKYYYNVSNSLPMKMLNSAHANLVVETDLDINDQFFLTEKTVKPLLTGQPFVVMASPHFLRHLRQMGFTTYESVWDESYDDITDFSARVRAVAKLCDDLGRFDWDKHAQALELIKLKNRSNFFNLRQLAEKTFIEFDKVLKLRF